MIALRVWYYGGSNENFTHTNLNRGVTFFFFCMIECVKIVKNYIYATNTKMHE